MTENRLLSGTDVWIGETGTCKEPCKAMTDSWLLMLSKQERERHDRLRCTDDRLHYLLAHVLVRRSLSCYFPLAPSEWKFTCGARGKPLIGNKIDIPLRFNLTHTSGLVACAVTTGYDCGIDAERISARHNPETIARRMFSGPEQQEMMKLEGIDRLEYFFERWTLREAYVKATGTGIAYPVRELQFLVPSTGAIQVKSATGKGDRHWQFALFRPTRQHVLSVALRGEDQTPHHRIRLRRFSFPTDN